MNSFTRKLEKKDFNKEYVANAPQAPGVYLFYDDNGSVLYVGKSVSLRNRLNSYFGKNLGAKTTEMVHNATQFSYVNVNSEIESLLFESYLVKKFMPKYNIALKDDKTPLYIILVKDKYPWVTTARKSQLKNIKGEVFGPFIWSRNVYTVLSTLRRIFPFANHKITKKPCFYSHLGLCNPCPADIENEDNPKTKKSLAKIYKRNIAYLRRILRGSIEKIISNLESKMLKASRGEDFENAKYYKQKLEALKFIVSKQQDPRNYYENPKLISDIIEEETNLLYRFIKKHTKIDSMVRIECFDIAHINGNFPAASMVTFINGVAEKSFYRHFRIRQKKGNSDTDSLSEVAQRRSKLLDKWGKPDLIIVDGGKGQVSAFFDIFEKYKIPVVGIAKRLEEMVFVNFERGKKKFRVVKIPTGPALFLVQKLRNEAHRFARRYHHILLKKNLLG